jgi:hypothetical protein
MQGRRRNWMYVLYAEVEERLSHGTAEPITNIAAGKGSQKETSLYRQEVNCVVLAKELQKVK